MILMNVIKLDSEYYLHQRQLVWWLLCGVLEKIIWWDVWFCRLFCISWCEWDIFFIPSSKSSFDYFTFDTFKWL